MKRRSNNENEIETATMETVKQCVNFKNDKTKETDKPVKKIKRSTFEKSSTTTKLTNSVKGSSPRQTVKTHGKKEIKDDSNKVSMPNIDESKPNWLQLKKEKKILKEKRRARRLTSIYEPSVKAKLIGEKLRRADCSADARAKLTTTLYQLLKGNFNKAVFTHDMSRVIQWMIKFGKPELRQSIIAELKPSFVFMFQSKYAKNCIKKALIYGTDEIRRDIISACYGHVVKLVSHYVSSPLVDYVYAKFATDLNKFHFQQEFYGNMYKQAKDNHVKTIKDVYALATDLKSATLSAVKINLFRVLNKGLVKSPIVHAVLVDYVTICPPEDRSEIIVMLKNSIVELAGSENGAKLAMICIWHGTNKDRKVMLRAMREQVKNLSISEHGYIILMAIFDCVDDTVLVKKLILSEILEDLVEIASNEYGRRVILYLVARRDKAYFHTALIDYLKQGDNNTTSKKSSEIREKEHLESIVEPLVKSIAENVTAWLCNSSIAMVTLAILRHGYGDKLRNAFEAIVDFIANDESKVKEENGIERTAVEHSGLHMILKKLILTDKGFAARNLPIFGLVLVEKLDKNIIKRWINLNRACFLLILIIENSVDSAVTSLKRKLKSLSQMLRTKKGPGASILLKKIE